jgi:hypothetical protein
MSRGYEMMQKRSLQRADKEDDVKRKVVSGVLAVIGILALSAVAAQAGNGGMPFALTSFFVCNTINGDDPGRVVDIVAPNIGPARQHVKLSNGTLACAVAKLFVSGTNTEIQPNAAGVGNTQLKCYSVTTSPRNSGSPPPSYSITDQLFTGTDTGVQDNGIQFICAPAQIFRE